MRYPNKLTISAMQCKFLLAATRSSLLLLTWGLFVFSTNASYAETPPVPLDYQYTGKHGLDLSQIKSGPLFLEPLSDRRTCDATSFCEGDVVTLITTSPLAPAIKDSIRQAFHAGNAQLANDPGQLILRGELIEAAITGLTTQDTTTSSAKRETDSLRVILKIKLQLLKENKIIWQNTVIGKSDPTSQDGLSKGITNAIDTLLENLFYDDYFVMELID